MQRGLHVLVGALLLTTVLAGCLGGDSGSADQGVGDTDETERSLTLEERGTESERALATVAAASGGVTYGDLVVTVNGEPYGFAADASYRDATYTANGIADEDRAVEEGHIVQVPAAGPVSLEFRDGTNGVIWSSYETTVPDDDAPTAPTLQAPADGQSGVSRSPTFEWAPVSDPSGVSYSLEVSLDEDFSQDLVVERYEEISSTQFSMSQENQLAPAQTYYWHVQPTDGEDNTGTWSPTWSFTTEPR